MTANQDIELKSPAEAILGAYDSALEGMMPVPWRLGLVETDRRTVAAAAGSVRTISAVLTGAIAQIPGEQQLGLEAWRDTYVARQNIVLFEPGSSRGATKAYSILAMKHLADLTWNRGKRKRGVTSYLK